jgi:hypothetical protein
VNRLAQFLQYTTRVFALKGLLRSVREGRVEPRVPLLPLALCLVLGVVTRIGSYLDLAQQTKDRRRWRHLCGLKAPVQHEIFAYLAEVIYQGGHRRWGIENKAFNELTQYYHLEHCYHHDPTSMLVQMLIVIFGFALFSAFALHSQLVRSGELTLKALAHQLDLALEEDLPWDLWFHSG